MDPTYIPSIVDLGYSVVEPKEYQYISDYGFTLPDEQLKMQNIAALKDLEYLENKCKMYIRTDPHSILTPYLISTLEEIEKVKWKAINNLIILSAREA
jgi:hypothetical protein